MLAYHEYGMYINTPKSKQNLPKTSKKITKHKNNQLRTSLAASN
jgi:hypothetical protein